MRGLVSSRKIRISAAYAVLTRWKRVLGHFGPVRNVIFEVVPIWTDAVRPKGEGRGWPESILATSINIEQTFSQSKKTPPERGLCFTVSRLIVRNIQAMVRYPIPLTAVLQTHVCPALR